MAMQVPKLIIVIPCYNEEATLPVSSPLFADELAGLIASGKVSNESRILLVDDGSADGTWQAITKLAADDSRFIGIRQSRNRGHQCALWAGLMEARDLGGDVTITIDCDGQDDIHAMAAMMDESRPLSPPVPSAPEATPRSVPRAGFAACSSSRWAISSAAPFRCRKSPCSRSCISRRFMR